MIKFNKILRKRRIFLRRKGTAAVEFAIIAPTLMLIFIATFQILLLLRTSQKLNTMVGNVAAMVAMQDPSGQLSPSTLSGICQGAVYGLDPFPANGLTLDIASVTVTTVGTTVDYWESDYAGGNCSPVTPAVIGGAQACSLSGGVSGATNGGMLPITRGVIGDNVIIVRATLTYPGMVGLWLKTTPTLTQTTFTRWDHATSSTELEVTTIPPTSENCTS
jgi:Flp pilus assembly protein TadG